MLQIIYESFVLLVAFGMGLYTLRYMGIIYRIFFVQLLFYILIYILGEVVVIIERANKMPLTNQWVYNIDMPVETGMLTWAGYEYFNRSKAKLLLGIGYAIFLVIFISEIIIKGIGVLSNHASVAQSLLLVITYLLVLYSEFTKQNMKWKRSPEVWISFGLVLYFAGVVPYFSLIHYLQEHNSKINLLLFNITIIVLSNIRYLLLAVGFWFVRKNVLSKITGLNG